MHFNGIPVSKCVRIRDHANTCLVDRVDVRVVVCGKEAIYGRENEQMFRRTLSPTHPELQIWMEVEGGSVVTRGNRNVTRDGYDKAR